MLLYSFVSATASTVCLGYIRTGIVDAIAFFCRAEQTFSCTQFDMLAAECELSGMASIGRGPSARKSETSMNLVGVGLLNSSASRVIALL